MNACYGCKRRRVWHDDSGKPHTCHEDCPDYERDRAKIEKERKAKEYFRQAQDATARSVERLVGKYKWNKG